MKLLAAMAASILVILACGNTTQPGIYSPEPSVLSAVAEDTVDTISLSWTRSTEEEDLFDRYILWRSESDSISSDTTVAVRLAVISDQDVVSFTDDSLGWDRTYYYAMVTVSYLEGGRSWSNEVSATTPQQP